MDVLYINVYAQTYIQEGKGEWLKKSRGEVKKKEMLVKIIDIGTKSR